MGFVVKEINDKTTLEEQYSLVHSSEMGTAGPGAVTQQIQAI